jgi:hypothetical protein
MFDSSGDIFYFHLYRGTVNKLPFKDYAKAYLKCLSYINTGVRHVLQLQRKGHIREGIGALELAEHSEQIVVAFIVDSVAVDPEGALVGGWVGQRVEGLEAGQIVADHQVLPSFGEEGDVSQSVEGQVLALVGLQVVVGLVKGVCSGCVCGRSALSWSGRWPHR